MFVPLLTNRLIDRGIHIYCQRTGPKIISILSETQCCNTQLVVGISTSNPQCSTIHRCTIAIFWNKVTSCRTIIPHVTRSIDTCPDIVYAQFGRALSSSTSFQLCFLCRLLLDCSLIFLCLSSTTNK